MQVLYTPNPNPKSNSTSNAQQLHEEIAREQVAEHLQDMRRLSDLAFTFLNAANGDYDQAAELFE